MRRLGPALVPTALAAVCGLAVAAQLRRLVEPAPGWRVLVLSVAASLAVAWLVRALPGRRLRLLASALLVVIVGLVAVRRDTGRWPVQEDLSGRDGYLGPLGYLQDASASVEAMARGWVRAVFPIAQAAEPHAAAALLAVGLALVLVAAVALIAFRTPLPAILAVATATAIGTLFTDAPRPGLQAVLLAALAVALLLLVGDVPRGRGPVAVGAVALVVGLAAFVGLAGPLSARDAGWSWRAWTLEVPPPVGVGFVWNQSLAPIDFRGEPVPVLRVDSPDAGYLRVAVLSRFDGVTWSQGLAFGGTSDRTAFPLPETAIPKGARIGAQRADLVVIRNLQLRTDELPLPVGATAVTGLPDSVVPARPDSDGVVRLAGSLPVGAQYGAEVIRVAATPELLDADVLGAPTDPAAAVVGAIPSTGRNADQDPTAPWSAGADQRAAKQSQPGPFGQTALDAARPPRSPEPSDAPAPDAVDVSFAGIVFPAFGRPGREREVQRLLRDRIALGGLGAVPLDGWRRAYRVAHRVTAKATTPYEAAVLLEDWFHRTSRYDERASYSASPLGPLPQFILDPNRRGHCQYFAGSMAAMLRMLGIPARVAAGFTAGVPDGGGRLITDRNAHVWVEVRFPYAGWVPFEPTPGRSLPAQTSSTSPSFAQSAAGVGGGALAGIIGRRDTPGGVGPHQGGAVGPGYAEGAVPAARGGGWPLRGLLVVLGALAVAAALLAAVWLRKRRSERAAFGVEDPDVAARALRDVVAGWLADQGAATDGARVADVAGALRRQYGVDAAAWADALVRAGYAPPAEARRAVGDARRETRAVVERMRARMERRERVRGAVRPRVRRRGRRRWSA